MKMHAQLDPFNMYLIKIFSKEEFALDFIEKGTMKIGKLSSFHECDGEGFRKDKLEGVNKNTGKMKIYNTEPINIKTYDNQDTKHVFDVKRFLDSYPEYKKELVSNGFIKLDFQMEYILNKSIYCMCYFLPFANNLHLIDEMKKFGSYAVFIHKPKDFLNRVKSRVSNNFNCGPVKYISKNEFSNTNNILGTHIKLDDFLDQNEYRLSFNTDELHNEEFHHIGNISDISYLMDMSDFEVMINKGVFNNKGQKLAIPLSKLEINRLVNVISSSDNVKDLDFKKIISEIREK